MALSDEYAEQIVYVEVYTRPEGDHGHVTAERVIRRIDVSLYPDANRRLLAVEEVGKIDRRTHGVRIARYTIEVYETF